MNLCGALILVLYLEEEKSWACEDRRLLIEVIAP